MAPPEPTSVSVDDEDVSILSNRLGYDRPEENHFVVCEDPAERDFLIQQQRKYRKTPEVALARLREAERQMKMLAEYSHFNQAQQDQFVADARVEIDRIVGVLDIVQGVKRPQKTTPQKKFESVRNGAILQMVEAATLGMPLEVWKTRMGRFRDESTLQALKGVYNRGGGGIAGVKAFWSGTSAKMVESASKGAVLMFSKEQIKDSCLAVGISPSASGFIAGAGGGICQVSVMSPCTLLVTGAVTGAKGDGILGTAKNVYARDGIRGFYKGGVPIAFRQATNWASRQGFTDAIREIIKRSRYDDPGVAKLTVGEEVMAGMLGGTLACWNHPFEVARIESQSRAVSGQAKLGMLDIFRLVVKDYGMAGLFKGVVPRIFLGIWQTTFMVTGANLIRHHILHEEPKHGSGH